MIRSPFPALMALAFVGAIGAAYLNPRLLEPVEIDRPAQSEPDVQQQPVFLTPQQSVVSANPHFIVAGCCQTGNWGVEPLFAKGCPACFRC